MLAFDDSLDVGSQTDGGKQKCILIFIGWIAKTTWAS